MVANFKLKIRPIWDFELESRYSYFLPNKTDYYTLNSYWTHYFFSDWPKAYSEFSKSAPTSFV